MFQVRHYLSVDCASSNSDKERKVYDYTKFEGEGAVFVHLQNKLITLKNWLTNTQSSLSKDGMDENDWDGLESSY